MNKNKKLFWEVWKQRFENAGHPAKTGRNAVGSAACGASLLLLLSANALAQCPERMCGESLEAQIPGIAIPGKTPIWNEKIADLARQIIKNLPAGEMPRIGVMEFKEASGNRVTDFSRRLREDMLLYLFQTDRLKVQGISAAEKNGSLMQIAKVDGLDYYVRGIYRNESDGLSVKPQLVSASTGQIVYDGSTHFPATAISAHDSKLLERDPIAGAPLRVSRSLGGYEKSLQDLIALKAEGADTGVQLWTDKNRYGIGDLITFSVKVDKPGYLILIEISPDGGAKVIFPNAAAPDNHLKAGVTHNIPRLDSGVEFKIAGPIGKERFKALFSESREWPLDMVESEGFYTIRSGTPAGEKDLKALVESFSGKAESEWAETMLEIFIHEQVDPAIRGTDPVPLVDRPDKPIDMIGTTGKEDPVPLVDRPDRPIDMIGTSGKEPVR